MPAQLKLLQKGAPPFRDTYQTASYLATRKALAHPEPRANAALLAQIDAVSRKALLFEIGNELDFVLSEARRIRSRYAGITVVPMLYRLDDNRLYLLREKGEP